MIRPLFTLDNRLAQCAEYVRQGKKVADIGTDHAYLPVWLVKTKKTPYAIAADIKEAPLQQGNLTIKKYHAEDCIQTRLSSGLENILQEEADDIVIAGMGGELIIHILSACPWISDKEKHLVLQPMSRTHLLRTYLYENGFAILKEKAVLADGRIYTVISAAYTGKNTPVTIVNQYAGRLDPQNVSLDRQYIEKEISALEKQAKGMLKSENPAQAKPVLTAITELQNWLSSVVTEKEVVI